MARSSHGKLPASRVRFWMDAYWSLADQPERDARDARRMRRTRERLTSLNSAQRAWVAGSVARS